MPVSYTHLDAGLSQGRLKTGTPARIDGRTIDFSKCIEQPGDLNPVPHFSLMEPDIEHPRQVPCWITHTNKEMHEIILSNLDRSPMYSGVIKGIGPRYCLSLIHISHEGSDAPHEGLAGAVR